AVVGLGGVRDIVLAVTGVVNRVRVGVVHGRGQTVHITQAQTRLERVIIRGCSGIEVQDVEEIRIWTGPTCVRQRLIYVVIGEQLAAERAHIADLHRCFT